MKITIQDIEREPFLKLFVPKGMTEHTVTDIEELEEIEGIRVMLASPVIRCIAIKDNNDTWKVGDEVGIREVDLDYWLSKEYVVKKEQ